MENLKLAGDAVDHVLVERLQRWDESIDFHCSGERLAAATTEDQGIFHGKSETGR
jgi:hypothetical protein